MTRLPAGVHSLRDRSMPPPGWSAYAAASWGSTVRAWTPGLPGGRPWRSHLASHECPSASPMETFEPMFWL